jgi:uncharacterized protein with GYD domain
MEDTTIMKVKCNTFEMPTYMIQGAYNSEGLSAVVKNPQDRFQAVKPAIEKVGGIVLFCN